MSTENEYSRAALALVNYVTRKHVTFETPEEIILQARQEFQERFSPEKLASLPDSVLLDTIFLSAKSNNESLCYHLEFNPKYKQFFGSISGGSSYKFGLFQKQDNMNWMTGSPQNPRVLSPEDALLLGKKIRDALIKGYNILASSTLETVDDYDVLDGKMSSELGQYASYAWFQKYFFMFFPSKLVGWYTIDWIRHYLYGLGIVPKENYYSINGQLAIIKGLTGLPDHHFQELCNKVFGEKRRFYRLTSSDEKTSYADDWRSRGMVAIGWNKLSDLIDYVKNGVLDRTRLTSKMESAYYQGDSRLATRKTAEIKSFFESKADDIIIVSDGDRLIGLVDKLSPYFYDPAEPMSHCKKGTWHSVFADTDRLPIDEGLKSACHEIQKAENLIYLYGKYFNLYERFAPTMTQQILSEADGIGSLAANTLPNRLPRTSKKHSLNTILYGAPGTGKTYSTAEYAMAIIEDADLNETLSTQEARKVLVLKYKGRISSGQIVFTTFHQSYGYEDFIQGLRPVQDSTILQFQNSDGVFKQIAERAMVDNENNYVLIIDEINRANISKVFGELITLIETDKRWGEVNELSATLPSGEIFAVPNNLYIIGTMNSADKSISLIDTALRRRFDFIETTPNAELVENAVLHQVLIKLNEELLSELDSTDLLIGHAYFIGKGEKDLIDVMNRNVIPLLYEYFFDNSRKVRAVINKAIEDLPYMVEDRKTGRLRIVNRD